VWELVDPPALGDVGDPVRYHVSRSAGPDHHQRLMTGGDARFDLEFYGRREVFAHAGPTSARRSRPHIADMIGPKVWGHVNAEACIGSGVCALIAREVFTRTTTARSSWSMNSRRR
jgi:hypothetical protein